MVRFKFVRALLLFTCFFLSNSALFAQEKQGANWLFGGKYHLDFNPGKPVLDTFSFVGADTLFSGVATMSNKKGELLFFTTRGVAATRQQVNGQYQAMPNGRFFTGGTYQTTIADLIVQSPADSNIYYLFFTGYDFVNNKTSSDLYQLQIDMQLNNGYGDVVPNSLRLLKRDADQYKLTALLHQNNRDTWVMAANRLNDSLYAYLVTPGGLQPPVVTKVKDRLFVHSRLKAAPNSELFAVSGVEALGAQTIQLYNFDRATGIPTFRYSFQALDPDYPFFSFAFSAQSNLLYAGTVGYVGYPKNATLYQYDLTLSNAFQVEHSRNVIYSSTNYYQISDMQLAIDGKLYVMVDDTWLGRINCPDHYGPACGFLPSVIVPDDRMGGSTLPTLNQTLFRNAGKLQILASKTVICTGDSVILNTYGAGAERFKWEIVNGAAQPADTLADLLVKPTATTTYRVTGTSTCTFETATVQITVLPRPAPVFVTGPQAVLTLAENQRYAITNARAGSRFTWSVSGGTIVAGQGQPEVAVNWSGEGTGMVSVIETSAGGCTGEKVDLAVQVSGSPEPLIYNVITPNNDKKNDALVIENLKWYPENELRIFNRWGVEVFKTSDYQNTWNADKVSAGTYYYRFTAKGKTWKGWVEVLK